MITSFLQGGLGNQMFQITAAYALSRDLGVDCAFNLNRCHTPAQGNTSNKYKDNIFKNSTMLFFHLKPKILLWDKYHLIYTFIYMLFAQ